MRIEIGTTGDQHDLELGVEVEQRLQQGHGADDLVTLRVRDVLHHENPPGTGCQMLGHRVVQLGVTR